MFGCGAIDGTDQVVSEIAILLFRSVAFLIYGPYVQRYWPQRLDSTRSGEPMVIAASIC